MGPELARAVVPGAAARQRRRQTTHANRGRPGGHDGIGLKSLVLRCCCRLDGAAGRVRRQPVDRIRVVSAGEAE
jgi:hypothetical protein